MVQKRYTSLRIIATINKILGILVGIITVLVAFGFLVSLIVGGAAVDSISQQLGENTNFAGLFGGVVGGLIVSIIALFNGLVFALALYAFGEGIYLFLDMEANTRMTAGLLQRQLSVPAPAGRMREEIRKPLPASEPPPPLEVETPPVVEEPVAPLASETSTAEA